MIVCVTFLIVGLTTSSIMGAEEPFDVSLARTQALDLSPYYRRVVEEAAAHYRGDFTSGSFPRTDYQSYYGSLTRELCERYLEVFRTSPLMRSLFSSVFDHSAELHPPLLPQNSSPSDESH
jgi:hypothetical protein